MLEDRSFYESRRVLFVRKIGKVYSDSPLLYAIKAYDEELSKF